MFLPIGLECWVLFTHRKSQTQTTQRKSTLRCKWEIWPALPAKANSPNRSKILVSDHKLQSWCEPALSPPNSADLHVLLHYATPLFWLVHPKTQHPPECDAVIASAPNLLPRDEASFAQRKKGFPSPSGRAPNNETAKCILWLWEFHIFELCPGVVLLLLFSGKRISAVSGLEYREFCTLETITSHCRVCVFDPAGCILFRTLLHLLLGPQNVCRLYGIRFLLAWSVLFQ